MDLSVRVEELSGPGDGWTLARVAGELDVATAPALREQLLRAIAAYGPRLVLDLDDVAFLDSTGLGVIVGVLKRTRTLGGDLAIAGASPAVRRVFEITALDRTLAICSSVDEALAQVTAG